MTNQLVIAYTAPPFNDGSAVTVMKRIYENAQTVDLISADMTSVRQRDESLYSVIKPYIDNHWTISTTPKFTNYDSVIDFVQQGLAKLEYHHKFYDFGYSRSMWIHSHFLAALLKIRGQIKNWRAEFSDPLMRGVDGSERGSELVKYDAWSLELMRSLNRDNQLLLRAQPTVIAWAQLLPFALADELVFTNPQQMEVMLEDTPPILKARVEQRALIAPHPTLPTSFYTADSTETLKGADGDRSLKIAYFGNFYPNRGGGEFLEAMCFLDREIRDCLELHVFSDGGLELQNVARTLQLTNQVYFHAPIPFLDFLKRTSDFQALLVNDISTKPFGVPSPFLPSKFSDYRGSKAEIMALTIEGSPLDQSPLAWKAHIGDTDSIVEMLESFSSHFDRFLRLNTLMESALDDLLTVHDF